MSFDPYQEWLGIPPDRRPPTHYGLLGLPVGESDQDRIRQAVRERYAHVRKYTLGSHGTDADRLLGELSQAVNCLTDPERGKAYLKRLREEEEGPANVDVAEEETTLHQDAYDMQSSIQRLLDEELLPSQSEPLPKGPLLAYGPPEQQEARFRITFEGWDARNICQLAARKFSELPAAWGSYLTSMPGGLLRGACWLWRSPPDTYSTASFAGS